LKKYNINKRPYYFTNRNKENILIYPLTKQAKEELKITKDNLKNSTVLVKNSIGSISKELNQEMNELFKQLNKKGNYLIINRNHLETLKSIMDDMFTNQKINKIAKDEISNELTISYKISSYFIKSILGIK